MKNMLESMKPTVTRLHLFLDYMGQQKPPISSRKLLPGKKTCFELSHLLADYRQYEKPNYTIDRYPLIYFLFSFSKEIQLLQYDTKAKCYIQGANAEHFKKLSIPAQYCVMITYMFTSFDDSFYNTLMFTEKKDSGMKLSLYHFIQENSIYIYYDFFQLIKGVDQSIHSLTVSDLDWQKITKKKYPFTKLGKCFLNLSEQAKDELNPYMASNLEEEATYESKQDRAVKMLWKEFHIEEPDLHPFFQKPYMDGTYILNVTLEEAIWVFSAGADATLEDLHIAIQRAADFDFDHPYYFQIDDVKYFHEFCDDEQRFAYQYTLGEMNLCKKKHFIYLFDFGAYWKFDIVVKDRLETETNSEIKLLEQKGKIPHQYDEFLQVF